MTKLFEEFGPVTDQEWIDKITQDLKGKSIEDIAKNRPYEDIDLKVFYTLSDAPETLEVLMNNDWKISDEEMYLESTMADPIHHLLTMGDWMTGEEEKDFESFISMYKNESGEKKLGITASIYHLAGASAINELALVLAHTNEFFNVLNNEKMLQDDFLGNLTVRVGIGSDYFMEIAKLRAIRILVRQLARSYGIKDDIAFTLYGKNGLISYSTKDADTNILRATTACMSGVIGGCDNLILQPHDRLGKDFHEFGDRIARNIQLMMKHEGHLDKVADAGAGSYFIEWLTKEISSMAWEKFKEIEDQGGLIRSFKEGKIQNLIEKDADKRLESFNSGEDVFIGINKYENPGKGLERVKDKFVSGTKYKSLAPLILEDKM